MPFVIGPKGQPILRCINHDVISHVMPADADTTMEAEKSWGAIASLRVIPQLQQLQPGMMLQGVGGTVIRVDPGRGQTVRAYTCTVCGYVELYDAEIINPNWKNERAD